MNKEKFQSLCAVLWLAGLLLLGVGGWGTYYYGSKATKDNEDLAVVQPSPPLLTSSTPAPVSSGTDVIRGVGSLESNVPTPDISPVAVPPPPVASLDSLESKATPALAATQPTPSATPEPSPSPAPKKARALSDRQHRQIVDILRKQEGKTITICSVESDAEGLEFAGILKSVFVEAGWQVDGVKQVSYGKPPSGLNLASGSFPSPESAVAAYMAFTSAGFKVSQQLDSKLTGSQAELIVGRMQ